MKKIRLNNKGFTLVELIVVLVILGILLAIGVPSILGYMDKKKADECAINRQAILLDLSAERILSPGKTLQAIIETEKEKYQCPAGGVYEADGEAVRCSHPGHGEAIAMPESQESTDWKQVPQKDAP